MGKIKIHKKAIHNAGDLINNMFICLCCCNEDDVKKDFNNSFYNEFHKKFNKFAELSKDARNYKYYINIDKAEDLGHNENDFLNAFEADVDITFLYDDEFEAELTRVMKATGNKTKYNHVKHYYECISKEVAYHAFDASLEMFVVAEH